MFNDKQLMDLSELIKEYIRQEFSEIHLSGNLMDTVKVGRTENSFFVEIPAEMYDISKFNKEGVIVYTGKGSYAELVDITGGFSKKHKNYVENAIKRALHEWITKNQVKVEGITFL